MYRCIPSSSEVPLTTEYSVRNGGRWNPEGSFPVLYTFLSPETARQWVTTSYAQAGLTFSAVQPERLPDLMILNGTYENVADLTVDAGLTEVGLPTSYPVGYFESTAWSVTQPIGTTIYTEGHSSVLVRSASASSWDGSTQNWAELVIFVDQAQTPEVVERVPYKDWIQT